MNFSQLIDLLGPLWAALDTVLVTTYKALTLFGLFGSAKIPIGIATIVLIWAFVLRDGYGRQNPIQKGIQLMLISVCSLLLVGNAIIPDPLPLLDEATMTGPTIVMWILGVINLFANRMQTRRNTIVQPTQQQSP